MFKKLFDPIISDRHNGYTPDAKQPTNMELDQLSDTDIDPETKYVLTTRVRTGRSVKGFALPPVISFEQRRKLEVPFFRGGVRAWRAQLLSPRAATCCVEAHHH